MTAKGHAPKPLPARPILIWSAVSGGATLLAVILVLLAAAIASTPDRYPGTDSQGMMMAGPEFFAFYLFIGGIVGGAVCLRTARRVTSEGGARARAFKASGLVLAAAVLVPAAIVIILMTMYSR